MIARQIVDCPFCNQPRGLHVTCAETRHVTLGTAVSNAILAASKKGGV